MNPTLQTLGQSLGHWQAVYIVSIVVAVLSTFAIVVFAFHIQEQRPIFRERAKINAEVTGRLKWLTMA